MKLNSFYMSKLIYQENYEYMSKSSLFNTRTLFYLNKYLLLLVSFSFIQTCQKNQ